MGKIQVEANKCERCGYVWWSKVEPLRCAKCKSPYWNKPREKNDGVSLQPMHAHLDAARRKPQPEVLPSVRESVVEPRKDDVDLFLSDLPDEEVEMCGYEEFDPESGETYRCSLRKHSKKVKHQKGVRV